MSHFPLLHCYRSQVSYPSINPSIHFLNRFSDLVCLNCHMAKGMVGPKQVSSPSQIIRFLTSQIPLQHSQITDLNSTCICALIKMLVTRIFFSIPYLLIIYKRWISIFKYENLAVNNLGSKESCETVIDILLSISFVMSANLSHCLSALNGISCLAVPAF